MTKTMAAQHLFLPIMEKATMITRPPSNLGNASGMEPDLEIWVIPALWTLPYNAWHTPVPCDPTSSLGNMLGTWTGITPWELVENLPLSSPTYSWRCGALPNQVPTTTLLHCTLQSGERLPGAHLRHHPLLSIHETSNILLESMRNNSWDTTNTILKN